MKKNTRDRSVYYKEYYETNKERIATRQKVYNKNWREKNKDILKSKSKKYYESNKDRIKERTSKQRHEKYHKNPGQELAKQKEWKVNNYEKYLLQSAKARAKKQNIPFDIVASDLIIPTHCPYLGIELIPFSEWASPSLDKIVPQLGYVVGNVQVISKLANTMKSCATIKELVTFAENVLKLHKINEEEL